MGNALDSVSKAVDSKFIGGNPLESKFAAIDKGLKDVKDWKDNIDKQRLDLKTKTAEQIREAEKYAFENMPNSETAKTRILADLAKYKDQMLMNERLVRNGAIPPEENLIFFQNGKQTFEIYADQVNNYDKELTKTEQRAKGYYKENDDGTQTFVPPVSGELEAIKQEIQTQIATLSGIETNFRENGMGDVTFFQMEVDPTTHAYRPKRDAQGNKIPLANTQPNMSVLALSHKANTRADRRYLTTEVDEFSQQTSLTYDTMFPEGLMVGNVVTDARNNPELNNLIKTKVAAMTTEIGAVASYFGKDNGFGGELVSFTQWDNLTDAQKTETITVTILDENLKEKQITYKKYAKVAAANENNVIVPELDENQIEATQGYVRKNLVAGLQKKITKGVKKTEWDPMSTNRLANRQGETSSVDLFEVVEKSYGGTPEEVTQSFENLMIRSGFKFEDSSPSKTVKDVRDKDVMLSQTYTVDKGDGAGMKTFELSLMVENPEWKKLDDTQIDKQKDMKKGDPGYIEQYVPVSREEYENKKYELFKKKGDVLSVSEARSKYKQKNKDYNPANNNFTIGNRDLSLTTTKEVDVAEIPTITTLTAVSDGGPTLLDDIKSSGAYKDIENNWLNDTNAEYAALAKTLQAKFNNMAALQGANQGGDIEITSDGENIVVKKGGEIIFKESNDDIGNEGLVEAAMSVALSKGLPGKGASKSTVKCDGGFKVVAGIKTTQRC